MRAKAARDFLHLVGFPSLKDLKKIIMMNVIANCPITHDDVNITEEIYGPNMAIIKGKTTQRIPSIVVQDYIDILPELVAKHENIVLYLDTIFINKMPFMVKIMKDIKFQMAHYIPNKMVELYHKTLDRVYGIYNNAGFNVT